MERLKNQKLEPNKVIKFFEEISKIPRRSGEEKAIYEYLIQFAEDRNLEYVTEENYNIIIRKSAAKGYEDKEIIAFQAHTDMICEKEEGALHDFSKDPILLYIEGDFIKANGTTLGADNGIGVAFMLAMLDDKKLQSPKLECIFTVQEETTMLGAIDINPKNIKSKRILSLDGGKEGKIVTSSANCNEWIGSIKIQTEEVENEYDYYELKYNNFQGGHSGGNIGDETRGNPIKLAIECIKEEKIRLVDVNGGSRVNVIPRDVLLEFAIEKGTNIDEIEKKIRNQKQKYGKQVLIELNKKEGTKKEVLSEKTTKQVIEFIFEYENGALNKDENGNVILSGNFAAIYKKKDYIQLEFSERSNDKKLETMLLERITKLIKKYEMNIINQQELKGIEIGRINNTVKQCKEIYKKLYNKPIEEVITQGVIEGGFFIDKIQNLEYACIGPNTYDVHSPNERVSISSMESTWKYLKEILKEI